MGTTTSGKRAARIVTLTLIALVTGCSHVLPRPAGGAATVATGEGTSRQTPASTAPPPPPAVSARARAVAYVGSVERRPVRAMISVSPARIDGTWVYEDD